MLDGAYASIGTHNDFWKSYIDLFLFTICHRYDWVVTLGYPAVVGIAVNIPIPGLKAAETPFEV